MQSGRYMSPDVRTLLIAYALVNAVLYSVLLPLWEGFDEPFHFGYVQQLANGQGSPMRARLGCRGNRASLLLAPASQAVKQNLPRATSYAEYFSWTAQEDRNSGNSWMQFLSAFGGNLPSSSTMKRTSRHWHIYG